MNDDKPDSANVLAIGPQNPAGATFQGALILEELRARAPFHVPRDLVVTYDESDGTARLHGAVPDEAMRGTILAIVRDVPGVKRIEDELRLVPRSRS